ncbi:MAG: hypothetical protein COA79_14840 [Planctomycetota bacterium]|nr:MAG: hypothetical protein COA79_14840 [Planctomycetota bacterium]
MKSLNFFFVIGIFLSLISCGNSNDINNETLLNPTSSVVSSFWGKPIHINLKDKDDLGKNVIIQKGNWDIVNGKLIAIKNNVGEGPEHILTFKKNKIGDFAIEFNARIINQEALESGGDLSAIIASDQKLEKRYDFQIGGSGNKSASISMNEWPIGNLDYNLKPNVVYKFRAEKIRSSLYLYCDDVLLLSCRSNYFLPGRINGIYTWGFGKEFWNIKYYERRMRGVDVELNSLDRILFKIINEPKKYFRYGELARSTCYEILQAYPSVDRISDFIYLRLSYLELSLGNIQLASDNISKLSNNTNEYEVSILKARVLFMKGDYLNSKVKFQTLLEKFKYLRAGTVFEMKGLLDSPFSNNLSIEDNNYFWNVYIKYSLNGRKFLIDANLTTLDFLKGLEKKSSYFDLSGNNISSLALFSTYGKISHLKLNRNSAISNLKDLGGIKIDRLYLSETKILSLEGVDTSKLRVLSLSSKGMKDLEILKDCLSIEEFYAENNKLTTIDRLKQLKLIDKLGLSRNKIKDISPINYEKMLHLNVSYNVIEEIASLKKAAQLEVLNISNNKITSLESLASLKNLKWLNCSKNPLKSFGSFSKTPPKTFFFDINLLDDLTINKLNENWSNDEYKLHKKNLAILIELKKGKNANIKQFATKKNRHHYLCVPVFLNFKDAKKFCKNHNGHLISIVRFWENDETLIERMPYKYWIGLKESANGFEWSTQEKVDTNNIINYEYRSKIAEKYYSIDANNMWSPESHKNELPFIIEWDQ